MIERTKTIAANITAIAIIAIILIWGNTWWRQWTQFRKGEEALARRDYIAAIAGYEAALHMYTPGSPFVGESAERLWGICEGFERAGDLERALIACRALRSSFYAVKWLASPGEEWIARCDAKIALLLQMQAARQQTRQ